MAKEIIAALSGILIWLALSSAILLLGFVLWKTSLRNAYGKVGPWPLGFAYLVFILAQLVSSLISDSSVFPFFVIVGFTSITVTLIGVPIAAILVRANHLSYRVAVVMATLYLLGLYMAGGATIFSLAEFLILGLPASFAFFVGLVAAIRGADRLALRALSEREMSRR